MIVTRSTRNSQRMPPTNQTDQRFIDGIAKGDSKVLEEIYATYSHHIAKLVAANNGTSEDARDVFQEGLMVLFRKVRSGDFELTSGFLTYFYAVCRHIWLKKLRKKGHSMVTFEDTMGYREVKSVEADYLKKERYTLYLNTFKLLGEGCRAVLELYAQGKSMKEIAATMGFASENYAKKRKFQCKKKLLLLIDKDDAYHELKSP